MKIKSENLKAHNTMPDPQWHMKTVNGKKMSSEREKKRHRGIPAGSMQYAKPYKLKSHY